MVVFSLTLIRHGETVANKKNVIQGQLDCPLSENGLQQALRLATRLQNQEYTHVFASDLLRARQTAQTVVDKNRVCKCPITQDPRLRERKFGIVEGKTYTDLKEAAKKVNKSVPNFTPPGAETIQQVRQRAILFFQEICQEVIPKTLDKEGGGSKRRRHDSESNGSEPLSSDDCSLHINGHSNTLSDELFNDKECIPNVSLSCFKTEHNNQIELVNNSDEYSSDDEAREWRLSRISTEALQKTATTQYGLVSCSDGNERVQFTFTDSSIKANVFGNGNFQNGCPNVSLSPLAEHRLSRVSSIDSDRKASIDSSNDEMDAVPSLCANVLIVSHGGLLRELIRHFVEDLGCTIPGGKGLALRISPNTGLSKFTITIVENETQPRLTCLLIHDKDHLLNSGMDTTDTTDQ